MSLRAMMKRLNRLYSLCAFMPLLAAPLRKIAS
jgi:hypothetical protein